MTSIESYLTIAGTAQRRLAEVDSEVTATQTAFPNGPDHTHLVQEIATCEAIVAIARAMLSAQMLQLRFTADGRAVAQAPDALRNSEYDQGSHDEPAN
jgi:hypothetical protein